MIDAKDIERIKKAVRFYLYNDVQVNPNTNKAFIRLLNELILAVRASPNSFADLRQEFIGRYLASILAHSKDASPLFHSSKKGHYNRKKKRKRRK